MPFKQSNGGIGLAGKGVTHSYEYTSSLEKQLAETQDRLKDAESVLKNIKGNPLKDLRSHDYWQILDPINNYYDKHKGGK